MTSMKSAKIGVRSSVKPEQPGWVSGLWIGSCLGIGWFYRLMGRRFPLWASCWLSRMILVGIGLLVWQGLVTAGFSLWWGSGREEVLQGAGFSERGRFLLVPLLCVGALVLSFAHCGVEWVAVWFGIGIIGVILRELILERRSSLSL